MERKIVTQKAETKCMLDEKEVFDEIVETVKENFIALFLRESNACLQLRFINGQRFRLTIENVEK